MSSLPACLTRGDFLPVRGAPLYGAFLPRNATIDEAELRPDIKEKSLVVAIERRRFGAPDLKEPGGPKSWELPECPEE
jgi:hypothetical protein